MKLYSWNVNGFRAIIQKPEWLEWFANSGADIIGLQETKAEPEQVPEAHRSPAGLHAYWSASAGKRGYSGVAVFAKNILYIFAAITNEIKYEKRQFKRRKRYENNVFHQCEK